MIITSNGASDTFDVGAGVTSLLSDIPSNDGSNGTEVVLMCFCAGTRIATPGRAVAVETLRAGDAVLTADAAVLPVRWLGVQTGSTRFADPLLALPIRIRAGAPAEGLPIRDLRFSPCHALLLGDVLVNAGALVDGTTVIREPAAADFVRYYHIKLDAHALVLAEGVAAESFLDGAEALPFDNAAERGNRALRHELPYPRVKARRQLPAAVRALLAARAAALVGSLAGAA